MEGEMAGVDLRADGELAGGRQVEEDDPNEVHEGLLTKAQDPVKRTAQVIEREKIELSPQLDQYLCTGLPHFDAVQVFHLPLGRWVPGIPPV